MLDRVQRQGRSQVFIGGGGGGGNMGQYKFINRNCSAESRKIVLLIFKPLKMSKKTLHISIILENFTSF